jgi:hypothetical protein
MNPEERRIEATVEQLMALVQELETQFAASAPRPRTLSKLSLFNTRPSDPLHKMAGTS